MAIMAGTIPLRIEPLPLTQNTEAGDTYEPGIRVYHPWYSDRQRFPVCQHAIMAVYCRSYCVLSHAYSSLSPSCLILNELRGRIVCIILHRYKPLSDLRKSESSSENQKYCLNRLKQNLPYLCCISEKVRAAQGPDSYKKRAEHIEPECSDSSMPFFMESDSCPRSSPSAIGRRYGSNNTS